MRVRARSSSRTSRARRRVFPAALTQEGWRVLEACDEEVDEFEREMFANLTPNQQQNLRRGLLTAVRTLNAGFPEE